MTGAVKRAISTIAGFVSFYSLLKACSGFLYISTDMMHMLSHRADVAIFLLVIKKLVCSKGIFTVMTFVLLIIKHSILYEGGYFLLLQQRIVFFRTVPGIGCNDLEHFPKAGLMLRQVGGHGRGICR